MGVCRLGAAHIHWLSWMPSLPGGGGLCGGYVGVSCVWGSICVPWTGPYSVR